jgi:hypothetical protein
MRFIFTALNHVAAMSGSKFGPSGPIDHSKYAIVKDAVHADITNTLSVGGPLHVGRDRLPVMR